jgi:ribulose-5-phosphate 4-epimerase/fuculose-1-phosphate aldolase
MSDIDPGLDPRNQRVELSRERNVDFWPPEFDSVDEERHYLKAKLAGAFRLFGRLGFGEGVAGHITVRDPGRPDHFWVNPFGMSFRRVRASDLILVNHDGEIVEGSFPLNGAAFAIHSQIHAARPDVVAAAHSHSVYGKALATLGVPLLPLTQDACAFYDDHVVHHDFGGVVADVEYGKQLAATLGNRKALIHQNHGLITVGESIDAAVWWFVTMERSCQAQLLAMAAGTPIEIDHDTAMKTREQVGSGLAGWFSFQPLWQDICDSETDDFRL